MVYTCPGRSPSCSGRRVTYYSGRVVARDVSMKKERWKRKTFHLEGHPVTTNGVDMHDDLLDRNPFFPPLLSNRRTVSQGTPKALGNDIRSENEGIRQWSLARVLGYRPPQVGEPTVLAAAWIPTDVHEVTRPRPLPPPPPARLLPA